MTVQNRRKKLRIAVTLGDPAGVGPEVSVKGINKAIDKDYSLILLGRLSVIIKSCDSNIDDFHVINSDDEFDDIVPGKKYIYNLDKYNNLVVPGVGSAETGAESLYYIDEAVRLWGLGLIDAVVTAPVHKGFIEKSGTPFMGHTEYIAEKIGHDIPYMMMFSPKYRVILATTHHPIEKVTDLINVDLLYNVTSVGASAIKSIDNKKEITVAITGLDPHCGDSGAIGDFDDRVTATAVAKLQNDGVNVNGPISADTIFMPSKWSSYDLVVVHYHDQGLIPFKMAAFDDGVNVTLGLKITRTSVDHGTAYDIAGKGVASFDSMVEAIVLANRIELGRK